MEPKIFFCSKILFKYIENHLQNHMRLDRTVLPRIMRLEKGFVILKKSVSKNMCILEIDMCI